MMLRLEYLTADVFWLDSGPVTHNQVTNSMELLHRQRKHSAKDKYP